MRHNRQEPYIAGSTELTADRMNRVLNRLHYAAFEAEKLVSRISLRRPGGITFELATIETREAGKFRGKLIGADSLPTGDTIDIYAMTIPVGADLTKCIPNILPGDVVWVVEGDAYVGGDVENVYAIATILSERCP